MIGRNVVVENHEIDIVALDGSCLCFVEVRSRKDAAQVNPLETVTIPKIRRLRRAAELFLAYHGDNFAWNACSFDVVGVTFEPEPELKLVQRGFRDMLSAGLYLVATPIGNLEDLTPRAMSVLEGVSRVYAEDTRHTQKLLNHFSLKVDLRSLHQHNEMSRFHEISELVTDGSAVALVTDAGTPVVIQGALSLIHSLKPTYQ